MAATILWYDLETFGRNPQHDRIAQCAFIRTTPSLEEVDEPIVLYCKPPPDYLPDPEACFVHGITPQEAAQKGLSEYEFALRVQHEMSVPDTTVAGYNSIQFDDEFIRYLFYRNLLDPYSREYRNDNSRWDIINLMRAVHDLKYEGFAWPVNGDGSPVFKLGMLAKANHVLHENAHDALCDVRATISLGRKVLEIYPKLFEWYYRHRKRESLVRLVDLSKPGLMLVHTSQRYTRPGGCSTIIAPLGLVETDRHALVAYDLRISPEPLFDIEQEALHDLLFSALQDEGQERPPISIVRLNSCPYLAPLNVLDTKALGRLGLNLDQCKNNLALLTAHPVVKARFIAAFRYDRREEEVLDPEYALYQGGFYSDADRRQLERFHRMLSVKGALAAKNEFLRMHFQDSRIPTLMGRLLARNFPETLTEEQRLSWKRHVAARIQLSAEKAQQCWLIMQSSKESLKQWDLLTHEEKSLQVSCNGRQKLSTIVGTRRGMKFRILPKMIVALALIGLSGAMAHAAPFATTSETLAIKIERAAVRAAPSFASPVLAFVTYKTPVAIIRNEGDWVFCFVKGSSTPGYLHKSALMPIRAKIDTNGISEPPELTAPELVLAGKGFSTNLEEALKDVNHFDLKRLIG